MIRESFALFKEQEQLFETSQTDFSKMKLKYKIIGEKEQIDYFRSSDGALTFLATLSDIEYAILYKKGTDNEKDLMNIKFWYSIDESDNYIIKFLNSKKIKEFHKNILDNTRVHKL